MSIYHGGEMMKDVVKSLLFVALLVIVAIVFFAIGGSFSMPQKSENAPSVSQEKIAEKIVEREVYITPIPTVTPVLHERIINPVPKDTLIDRPPFVVDSAASEIDWSSLQGSISKEDIAFWFGRENQAWRGDSKEIVYQKINSDVKEYRNKVIVKSAMFQRMAYSRKGVIHMVENISVGDSADDKVIAYAVSLENPNDSLKKIKMVFYYDDSGDIIAFGYGDSRFVITERNYVLGGNVSDGGDGGETNTDDTSGGPSEPVIQ